jgi:hypothetical protein
MILKHGKIAVSRTKMYGTKTYGVPLGPSRHTNNSKQRKHEITKVNSQNNETSMIKSRRYDDETSKVQKWKVEVTKPRWWKVDLFSWCVMIALTRLRRNLRKFSWNYFFTKCLIKTLSLSLIWITRLLAILNIFIYF